MTYHFCTYFDSRYLSRGLALYRSLKKYCPDFQLWVLCLDRECNRLLSSLMLPNVQIIDIGDLEKFDTQLSKCRNNRSLVEYYFTCTPSWLLYLFRNFQEPDIFTYLDADLFFFSDPAPLFEELAVASVGIIAHRFPPALKEMERFGIYNVGWLSFRRDTNADGCLQWWRERCIEWCFDRAEEGRFADQKYLDDWPSRFSGVAVLQHPGANVAPWNVAATRIQEEKGGKLWIDSKPLIFYHFHLLKVVTPFLYDHGLAAYSVPLDKNLKRIYVAYCRELQTAIKFSGGPQETIRYNQTGITSSILRRRLLLLLGPVSFELNPEPLTRLFRYLRPKRQNL